MPYLFPRYLNRKGCLSFCSLKEKIDCSKKNLCSNNVFHLLPQSEINLFRNPFCCNKKKLCQFNLHPALLFIYPTSITFITIRLLFLTCISPLEILTEISILFLASFTLFYYTFFLFFVSFFLFFYFEKLQHINEVIA